MSVRVWLAIRDTVGEMWMCVCVWTRRDWSVQRRSVATKSTPQVHQTMAPRETIQVSVQLYGDEFRLFVSRMFLLRLPPCMRGAKYCDECVCLYMRVCWSVCMIPQELRGPRKGGDRALVLHSFKEYDTLCLIIIVIIIITFSSPPAQSRSL